MTAGIFSRVGISLHPSHCLCGAFFLLKLTVCSRIKQKLKKHSVLFTQSCAPDRDLWLLSALICVHRAIKSRHLLFCVHCAVTFIRFFIVSPVLVVFRGKRQVCCLESQAVCWNYKLFVTQGQKVTEALQLFVAASWDEVNNKLTSWSGSRFCCCILLLLFVVVVLDELSVEIAVFHPWREAEAAYRRPQ